MARVSVWGAKLVDDEIIINNDGGVAHYPLADIGRTKVRRGLLSSSVEWGGTRCLPDCAGSPDAMLAILETP